MDIIWKEIPGYGGRYKVSSEGDVINRYGRLLKGGTRDTGYRSVYLMINGSKGSWHSVHRLVLTTFQGPSSLTIDHLNGIKDDNRLENLEYVTYRENASRYHQTYRDLPTGVHKHYRRYQAQIYVKGGLYRLGVYNTPELASQAYKRALSDLDNIEKYAVRKKPARLGYGIEMSGKKFVARTWHNGKGLYLGSFNTIEQAKEAQEVFKKTNERNLSK